MTATASHQWRVILWWVGSPAISLIPRLMSRTSLHTRKSLGTKLWSLVLWVQKYFPSLFLSFPLPSLSSPLFLFFPLLLFFSSSPLAHFSFFSPNFFLFSSLLPRSCRGSLGSGTLPHFSTWLIRTSLMMMRGGMHMSVLLLTSATSTQLKYDNLYSSDAINGCKSDQREKSSSI